MFLSLTPFTGQDLLADRALIELYRREAGALLEHELRRGNLALTILLAMSGPDGDQPLHALLPEPLRNPRILSALNARLMAAVLQLLPADQRAAALATGMSPAEPPALDHDEAASFEALWQDYYAEHERNDWRSLRELIDSSTAADRLPHRERCAALQDPGAAEHQH